MIDKFFNEQAEMMNCPLESFIAFLPDAAESTNLHVSKHTGFHTYPKIFLKLSEWVVNTTKFDIKVKNQELWGAIYDEGDYAEPHDHKPWDYSFVYYVNAPEGSSPIIFEDCEIEPSSGMCLVFPAHMKHGVKPNQCKSRIVLAGNYNVY